MTIESLVNRVSLIAKTLLRLSAVLKELFSVDYDTVVRHDDMWYVMRL